MKTMGAKESVSSSDAAPMVAVRDRRFTKSGIGWRSPVSESTSLNPGGIGQTPPPIMYGDDYPGGTAARKRGQVDEAKLPWETAQEASTPQIKPRVTVPPFGLDEALPPWLKGKGKDDEEKESLPPWLADKNKGDDEEKESARPDVRENWMEDPGEDEAEGPECEAFPDEEDAREALSTLAQFVDGGTLKAIQAQIVKQYGDPADDQEDDSEPPLPGFMGEAALSTKDKNKLPDSSFAIPEDRAYPIQDLAHARNALARVAQFGKADEKQRVQSAVYRKFPQLKPDAAKK